MLFRGGRQVVGFESAALVRHGLGAASTSTFDHAQLDLQNQVEAVVQAGDTYYQAHVAGYELDYTDAVLAYQAAGQAGATNVGPEIDASGAPTVTKPLTQQAWTLNGQLAQVPRSGAASPSQGFPSAYFTKADADKAKAIVTQMVTLYNQAISKGSASIGQSTAPVLPPTPTPIPSTPSALPMVALGVTAAAVATVVITRTGHKRGWARA